MYREIRELDLADLWRPAAGSVAPWVRVVILGAVIAMIGVAAASARSLWAAGGHMIGLDRFWFRNGLAIASAIASAAAFLPRARVSRFVRPVPIPVGAELAASLPELSTILQVGESVAVLRRGDRVVVGGLIVPAADHPFRGSSALVPGPAGVVVRREGDDRDDFADVALVAWRPCVALLVILTAVAIPALAAVVALR
jgi:hypothetical protein